MADRIARQPLDDHGAERLKEILKVAAERASADVYVAGEPSDVSTPAGIRKPDVLVVPKDVAQRDRPPGAHLLCI